MMPEPSSGPELQNLVDLLRKIPGLGPRSAGRAVLHLLKKRETLMYPLATALNDAARKIKTCSVCGNWDCTDPCSICTDTRRDGTVLCVVQDVADLWMLERTRSHRGYYHVLGGLLSPLDGIRPEDLNVERLLHKADSGNIREIILALSATVDAQTTAHYLGERLKPLHANITRLSHGLPVGSELNYLDEGTISAAISARHPVG